MIGCYHREVRQTDYAPSASWRVRDYRAYGQATSGDESGLDTLSQIARDLAPYAEGFSAISESTSDPVRQIAVLRSRLARARASGMPLWKLQELEGKIQAAEERLDRRTRSDIALANWRTLGMTAGVVGTFLLGTLAVLAISRIRRAR